MANPEEKFEKEIGEIKEKPLPEGEWADIAERKYEVPKEKIEKAIESPEGEYNLITLLETTSKEKVREISEESEEIKEKVSQVELPQEQSREIILEADQITFEAERALKEEVEEMPSLLSLEEEGPSNKQETLKEESREERERQLRRELVRKRLEMWDKFSEQRTREFNLPGNFTYSKLLGSADLSQPNLGFDDEEINYYFFSPTLIEAFKKGELPMEKLREQILEDRKALEGILPGKTWGEDFSKDRFVEEQRERHRKRKWEAEYSEYREKYVYTPERKVRDTGYGLPYLGLIQEPFMNMFSELMNKDDEGIATVLNTLEKDASLPPGGEEKMMGILKNGFDLVIKEIDGQIKMREVAGDRTIELAETTRIKYQKTLEELQRIRSGIQKYIDTKRVKQVRKQLMPERGEEKN